MNCKNCGAPLQITNDRMILCDYCKTRTRNPDFKLNENKDSVVVTNGGAYIGGSVIAGDFVGRDKIVIPSPKRYHQVMEFWLKNNR